MQHRSHRRARLTIEGRRLLVHRVQDLGWPAARAAEAMGVSRATAYKWLRRYREEGEAGLADRSSRPHHLANRIDVAREIAIVRLRRQTLHGPHRIGWALGEAPSTVNRVLRRNHQPRLADIDRATRTVVRYERDEPGELLHVDVKKQGRIPDGGGWRIHGRGTGTPRLREQRPRATRDGQPRLGYDYLHIAVDDHTRIAYVESHRDERKDTAAGFMVRAIDWFADLGITTKRVMTDNGSCYRSRTFTDVLAERDISHKRTRPYRPQTNGKVERFNRTIKEEWAYAYPYLSNRARLDMLQDFVHTYNHHRGHYAHNGGTPMSAVNNLPAKHT